MGATDAHSGKPVSFTNSQASVTLDLLRALAALLVLISHWKIMFFVDYPQIPAHKALFAIPYVLASAGHQSVLIFFVLSGYLIGGSIFRSLDGGFWSWRTYLTHRFARLYVVLLPGLLFGGLCDWVGLHYAHVTVLYNGVSAKTHLIDVAQTLSLPAFFGNLAFLQTITVPAFGSDGALWSLANEFWYYLLFPLGWLALHRRSSLQQRLLFGAAFLMIAWFTRSSILPLFPVWLAGAVLALLPPPKLGPTARALASAAFCLSIFLFSKGQFLPGLAHDYVFGAITFLYIWVLLSARKAHRNSAYVHWTRQAARFSFSLYVTHMPLLLLVTAFVAGDRVWSPTSIPQDALFLLILAMIIAVAYAFAFLTEFRTDSVRRWLEQRLEHAVKR